MLRLLGLAWQYRWGTIRLLILQVLLVALALSGLGLLGIAIDVINEGFDPNAKPADWPFGLTPPPHWSAMFNAAVLGLAIIMVGAVRFVLDRLSNLWKAYLIEQVVVDLRASVYNKLQRLSFRFFDANESGSLINRVTGDVQAVRTFVDGVIVQLLMVIISLAFFLVYMVKIHVWLTLACLATTPLLWTVTVIFTRTVKPAYRKNRELFDRAVRVVAENAQGVHVVKGFSLQESETEKFRVANDNVADQKNWIFWRLSFFIPAIGSLTQINLVILLLYGGWLYIHDPEFRVGSGLFVFAGLLQQFSHQVGGIGMIANSIQMSMIGAQRVFEVLDTPVEIESPPDAVPLKKARGDVSFEHVSFLYKEGNPALADIDFHIEAGQCVAILGTTGSGKSTLLSLLPRFYDPTGGRILIDGVDIRQYNLDALRRNIGVVFQESFMFSNSVAANIAFGHPEASQHQIEKAARIAAAHEFIMNDLDNGYETILTEGGANLSGGQRQRLAIARAILLEPPILLLDDPTAAIDPETENEILQAIDNAMAGRTTFVVAHRLSTLRRADLVIVLDKGWIVEMGTHEELMNSEGHYRCAANLQIADDESKRLLGLTSGGAA